MTWTLDFTEAARRQTYAVASLDELRINIEEASHLRTELATEALHMAVTSRRPGPGLIHHSDRGGQYLSAAYTGQLAEHGIRSSVGRPGTCFDNAAAETFFATLKKELLHRSVWPTRQHARSAIFHYVEGF